MSGEPALNIAHDRALYRFATIARLQRAVCTYDQRDRAGPARRWRCWSPTAGTGRSPRLAAIDQQMPGGPPTGPTIAGLGRTSE